MPTVLKVAGLDAFVVSVGENMNELDGGDEKGSIWTAGLVALC